MSTGLRLSAERRRLVEQLGPDNFALLARTLRHQDDAWRLERPGGRGDGQEEPEVPVDVEGDDDVVHACLLGPSAGRVAEFRPRVAPLMRLTYFVHGMVAGGALVAGSFLLGLSGISWAVAAIVIGSVGFTMVQFLIRGDSIGSPSHPTGTVRTSGADNRDQAAQRAAEVSGEEVRLERAPDPSALRRSSELMRATEVRLSREVQGIARAAALNLTLGAIAAAAGAVVLWLGATTVDSWPQDQLRRTPLAVLMELVAFFFFRLYRDNLRERRHYQNEITRVESRHAAFQYAMLTGAEHVAIAIRGLADLEVSTSEATAADPSRSRFSGEVQAGSQTRLRGTAD